MSEVIDTVQVKVGQVPLRVILSETKAGNNTFRYRSETTGQTLPPLSTLEKVRHGSAKLGDKIVPFESRTGKHGEYIVARFYDVTLGERNATIQVKCADDGTGEYVWSVTGSFPSGKRGRAPRKPTTGAEFGFAESDGAEFGFAAA